MILDECKGLLCPASLGYSGGSDSTFYSKPFQQVYFKYSGHNYVSLKLPRAFSQLKGCPVTVAKFIWNFGMADFLLKENNLPKLFYCKSIAMMNFNDNLLLPIKISNLECFLCYELFSIPISVPIKVESGFPFRISLQPLNNENIHSWFVFNGWIEPVCFYLQCSVVSFADNVKDPIKQCGDYLIGLFYP